MFDLKVIQSVLAQLEEERGVPKEKVLEAIELALATAYKKEYGKKGQIVKAKFDFKTGDVDFSQVKIVVDESKVYFQEEGEDAPELPEGDERVRFNPEQHILLQDAKMIKADAKLDEEIIFPLELKGDYGRIAAQTAKQVIIQKIREAEKTSVFKEYGEKEGEIVSGSVQRIERGAIYIDMGRATALLPYEEQIPGEHFKQGERIRAYLYKVEETTKGVFLKVSRSHPRFLVELFKTEVPELTNGVVEVKAVAREAGSRSKIAVNSNDEDIDPVGSLVGQRGVRVSTVMSELGGEKIDVIEWSEDPKVFIQEALSPAKVLKIETVDEEKHATVHVTEDQQSLAIGKGGQNVRLAAKLTGWKIDIRSMGGENLAGADGEKTDVSEKSKIEEPKEELIKTTEEPATDSKE